MSFELQIQMLQTWSSMSRMLGDLWAGSLKSMDPTEAWRSVGRRHKYQKVADSQTYRLEIHQVELQGKLRNTDWIYRLHI